MIVKYFYRMRNSIHRRHFLQGMGGSLLALPLLEANSISKIATPPKRIVATGVFYGFVPENFHPKDTGQNYDSPLLLKPLDPFRKNYTVLSAG